jgi:16S rRNA (guanine527-N7)-methyltransferase
MPILTTLLKEAVNAKKFDIGNEQFDVLSTYLEIVFKWHKKTNIIVSRNQEYFIKREIYDCIDFCTKQEDQTYIDIGTGAGLPGVLMAILKPYSYVKLLDKRDKIIRFLSHLNSSLKLKNIEIIHDRLEMMQPQDGIKVALIKNFSNKDISGMKLADRISYVYGYLHKKIRGDFKMVFLTGSEATRLDSCEIAVVDKALNCSARPIDNPFYTQKRFILEVV